MISSGIALLPFILPSNTVLFTATSGLPVNEARIDGLNELFLLAVIGVRLKATDASVDTANDVFLMFCETSRSAVE